MKNSKFSLNEIVKILTEHGNGKTAAEYSISQPVFFNWKKYYGWDEAIDLKRLKALEEAF